MTKFPRWSLAAIIGFSASPVFAGSVTAAQAKVIALKLVPGKVVEVEREKHAGEPVFSVEIKGASGVHEVAVRISDGSVLEDKVAGGADDEDEENDD